MNWSSIKTGIAIFFIILISELIRIYTGLPITIVDIGVLPITCLLVYYIQFYSFPFSKNFKDKNNQQQLSSWQLLGFLLFSVVMAIMGTWSAWIGIEEPLHYFSSVKGGAHGYTLIQLGSIIAIYSVGGGLVFLYRLIRLHFKSA